MTLLKFHCPKKNIHWWSIVRPERSSTEVEDLACHYTWPKCWTEIVYLTGNHYKNWNLLWYLLGYPSEILYQPPKRGTHLEAREFTLSQREFNTKKKLGFVQCSQSLCTEPGPNFLVVNGPCATGVYPRYNWVALWLLPTYDSWDAIQMEIICQPQNTQDISGCMGYEPTKSRGKIGFHQQTIRLHIMMIQVKKQTSWYKYTTCYGIMRFMNHEQQ